MVKNQNTTRNSFFIKTLKAIEYGGNKLPHPVLIFIYGILLILVLSFIFNFFGISVKDPRPESFPGRTADGLISAKSLLNEEGIRYILTTLIPNFISFAPLGTVLISMIGMGIAEKSGLIEASLKGLVQISSKRIITAIVVFAGIISNMAAEVGYIVLIPLGAMVFHSFGKHPIAGLGAAFAGVSGGYSANLLLGSVDPLLAGISQEAARFLAPGYHVGAESNWYFMFASVFLITILGTIVTEKIIEPMLGSYTSNQKEDITDFTQISKLEKKGLLFSGLFTVLFFIVLFLSIYPGKGILLNQKTMSLTASPFFASIVSFIFIFFAVNGIIYGFITNKFTKLNDIVNAMQSAMATLSGYIILAFFMAQFINYFAYTKLGIIFAISLADLVKQIGLSGSLFLVAFIFIIGFINLFMGSASAKWALLAPIFIPMFMLIGYSPELTQLAYRIGDSSTNIISPLMSYVPLIILAANKYIKDFGLGNLISLMFPYSVVFLIFWSVFLYVWVFLIGLPIGPEVESTFTISNIVTN